MSISMLLSIFLVLHGLVHLLYAGQSVRLFELRPGMVWPDGSWLFAKHPFDDSIRVLVSICLCLAALSFAAGGLGLFGQQDWWRLITAGAAVLSTAIYGVFWDGKRQSLADQGGIGVLINLAILVLVPLVRF